MKKMKILISTIALVGSAIPLGAFVCAAKTNNTNDPVNPEADVISFDWKSADTRYGTIDTSGATTQITEETEFGSLTLPKITPADKCHFGGWYANLTGTEELLTSTTVIPMTAKSPLEIRAYFYPDLQDVTVPENLIFTKRSEATRGTIQSILIWKDETKTSEPTYKWKLANPTSQVISIDETTGDTRSFVDFNIKGVGSEQVILSVNNGGQLFTKTCNVIVQKEVDPVKGITFSTDQAGQASIRSISLEYDGSASETKMFYYQLNPSGVKHTVEDVTFTLLDETLPLKVERVNPEGDLTQMQIYIDPEAEEITSFRTLLLFTYSKGDVTVSNSLEVIVKKKFVPIESITLETETKTLNFGGTGTITTKLKGAGGLDPTYPNAISWSSSNPSVVKVDKNGNIRALNATGEATITATAVDDPTSTTTVSNFITIRVVDLNWTVNISSDQASWIVGEGDAKWSINATDDGITIGFTVDELYHKVKDTDLAITYIDAQHEVKATVDCVGKNYTIIIPSSSLEPSTSREITIKVTVQEYYTVYLEAGERINTISLADIPTTITEESIAGKVQFFEGHQLCLDNCYAVWGDRTDPQKSKKLWGADAIRYDSTKPQEFNLLVPSDLPTTKQLTLHLDASTEARWTNITEGTPQHIYLGLEKNQYNGQIQFGYHTDNGYRIDENNTTVSIAGTSYPLNDPTHQGVFEEKGGYIYINPKIVITDAKPDVAIILNVVTIANDFDCAVQYEDSTKFDSSAFEIVQAIDNQEVKIKVKPVTNYKVAEEDVNRLYATITFIGGKTLKITDLTVGAVGADGKTPITMAWESEEWIGQISSIEFFVAADLIS